MKRLIGIVGSGMIGRDPFDERCWSGSSRNLFLEMKKQNILDRAFGVEAKYRGIYIIKNFSLGKKKWREKFYLDTKYYQALTNEIKFNLTSSDTNKILFQVGAHYDGPSIANGSKCFSYHDGNIAVKMKSPYMVKSLMKSAKRAFLWEKEVSSKMDMIFTMSEYLRNSFIEDYGIDPSRVKNIGVGINFELPKSKVIKNFDQQELLFIGIDFNRKGGHLVVEVFKKLKIIFPKLKLNIIGPQVIPESIKGVDDINFYGFLNRDIATESNLFKEILTRSTIGVLPSLYEPFGIGILEMMAYGIPCVLPNRWAFPEIIVNEKCGWLYKDKNHLFDILLDLLKKPGSLESKSNNSLERVNDYSWEKVVNNIKSVSN